MSSKRLRTTNSALSTEQLQGLCDAAIQAAQEAGRWIEGFDRDCLPQFFKPAGSSEASQLVTQVDIGSEKIIRKHLQNASAGFNIAFVGEESSTGAHYNSRERFEKPYFWCVDPLDGTLAFAKGRSGYAVSIALLEQSGKPLIGVVYDPTNKMLYHAIAGQGHRQTLTTVSQGPLNKSKRFSQSLMVYADASFKTHARYELAVFTLEKCAQTLSLDGVTFIYGNGAVKNACNVLSSSHSCYLKLPKKEDGGGSIWDYAATACIAQEAGAWASNLHGQALALNRQESTFMNHEGVIFASNSQIAHFLIEALSPRKTD